MGETKFGCKSGAHSENFSVASEIFAKLVKITVASEKFFDFFDFFFEKSNKINKNKNKNNKINKNKNFFF